MKLQTVANPTKEDLEFSYDSVKYMLKAGEAKEYPDHIARHAAKKLADREVRNLKDESKVILPIKHKELFDSYLGRETQLSVPDKEKEEELEELEKEIPAEEKAYTDMRKDELLAEAVKLGLKVDDSMTKRVLLKKLIEHDEEPEPEGPDEVLVDEDGNLSEVDEENEE